MIVEVVVLLVSVIHINNPYRIVSYRTQSVYHTIQEDGKRDRNRDIDRLFKSISIEIEIDCIICFHLVN